MSGYLCIHWAITPEIAPRPLINCNRCGGVKAYRCSEKFRVNANGKRIDVWLIYRCIDCDNSWNFGILERCNRRDIAPALLRALESNDPALARRHAFDVVALRSRVGRVEEFPDVTVHKQRLGEAQPRWNSSSGSKCRRRSGSTGCLPMDSAYRDRGFRLWKTGDC
jgi:hypothetical protein